jgi:hypothetical protein
MIVDAMIEVDINQIVEAKNEKFQKKWVVPASKGELPFKGEPQEIAGWDILKAAEALHVHGLSYLPVYHPNTLEKALDDQHLTCKERIDRICYFLRRSKSKVEAVIRGDVIAPLVAVKWYSLG